jgi:acyl carrier protein
MSYQQVPQSLRNLLADVLEVSPDEITPETGTANVESWDSFRHLQAVLAIEGEYNVQLDPQRIPELTTVAILQAELEKKGVEF